MKGSSMASTLVVGMVDLKAVRLDATWVATSVDQSDDSKAAMMEEKSVG